MAKVKNLPNFLEKLFHKAENPVKFDPETQVSPNSTKITNVTPVIVKTTRRLVVIECPWDPQDTNVFNKQTRYNHYCIANSLKNGEAPLSLYPQLTPILNLRVDYDRDVAFISQASWIPVADLLAVYIDHGITLSMQMSINVARLKNIKVEYRTIGKF